MPSKPNKHGGGDAEWTPEHTRIVVAGMIELVKANKRTLYTLPGIVGEVDNHGNNRTGSKVNQILNTLASSYGVSAETVTGGTKRKSGDKSTTSKRARKVKVEEIEEKPVIQ
ncbi:uncharacterized protein EHS24_005083 [Apiotrichum porosum]|uniref:Uncharacterized protein n=1 Tax=Apiotrichum porosum TaxID=105984 RepID=A0A427Y6U1_9TREE|nr:uncharacterized protein EHS24_005083 [Apiotrichum porosum]RSH86809.1 hypothetical protein EHS24_005083 [Apiotrichum porosum]